MNEIAKVYEPESREVGAVTPMEMIDRALANGSGVEVIERLMALQERWEANAGRKAFDHAIAAAKAAIPPIIKNREVEFTSSKGRTNYKHEDLAQIAKTVDPILASHGLSYRFRTQQADGGIITVTCILSHRGGYSEETSLSGGRDDTGNKNNFQAVGSAVTYLQRYTLKAALGLAAAHDDDGGKAETDTITADQFRRLNEKMDAIDEGSRRRLLAYLKVENLEELPQSKYGTADAALDRKIAEKGGGDA